MPTTFSHRLILVSGVASLILGCSSPSKVADSEAGNPGTSVASAMISMPTSMAAPEGTALLRSATGDPVDTLYSFIRQQNRFVDNLLNASGYGVRAIFTTMSTDVPWDKVKTVGSWTGVTNGDSCTVSFDSSNAFPYRVELKHSELHKASNITAAFNGDLNQPRGTVYYFQEKPGNSLCDSLKIRVDFNASTTEKYLTVTLMQRVDMSSSDGSRYVYDLHDDGTSVSVSACSFHPNAANFYTKTKGLCYDWQGIAEKSTNTAKVKVALPDIGKTDTTNLFDSLNVGELYALSVIDTLKKSKDTTIQKIIVNSYTKNILIKTILDTLFDSTNPHIAFRASLIPASAINSMKPADLRFIAKFNKDFFTTPNGKDWQFIALVSKLESPAYLGAQGYAGCGATAPTGFESVAKKKCSRQARIPANARDLIVTKP